MSTAQGSGEGSSPESVALGEALTFFGTVADYAAGAAPEDGERIASLASGMAGVAGLPQADLDALYYATRLRNAGALGNPAFAKGERLPDRARMMQQWDIPSDGARLCERIGALPRNVADFVRWQSECWDGTGFPDQLRWYGIPQAAGLLHIAATYVATEEPEEALALITGESGRTFAPEQVRAFVLWYHTNGGEIDAVVPRLGALDASRSHAMQIIEMLSERVDAHNGTPLRAQRIARRAAELGRALCIDAEDLRRTQTAALTFGIGEIRATQLEAQQFDPLARLGIKTRANHACIAAGLAQQCPFLENVAPALRARAEWYDGTGRPDGLRHDAIPRAGHLLSIAIAFDALDESYRSRVTKERVLPLSRLETVSGTQFEPGAISALADIVKVRA